MIYTIGHSNRNLAEFVKILKGYGINLLIDVRRFPTSKWPHFKKPTLEAELPKHSIRYVWMGDRLGGFRKGGYREYAKTKRFERAIDRLVQLAQNNTPAIMCAERFPWRCHRRYIAEALEKRGIRVVHILNGRIWSKSPTNRSLSDPHNPNLPRHQGRSNRPI